ncbi:hypothetical protein K7432_018016 [Basidiobolus ranarum]|uniref:Uncharacterized protein n=1 Tax=Basidiobolus ranarum TaxID=34480 RepID=A0ABR2VKN4_9FUNG
MEMALVVTAEDQVEMVEVLADMELEPAAMEMALVATVEDLEAMAVVRMIPQIAMELTKTIIFKKIPKFLRKRTVCQPHQWISPYVLNQ